MPAAPCAREDRRLFGNAWLFEVATQNADEKNLLNINRFL